jgi:hypothetical protein
MKGGDEHAGVKKRYSFEFQLATFSTFLFAQPRVRDQINMRRLS